MVVITAYDPRWPTEFQAIGAMLRSVLSEHALRIDHIGSTSVPGLAAKDRIDIQIAVANFERFDELRPRVEALGYLARPDITADHEPPGWQGPSGQWEKRYFTSPPGLRAVNIHLRVLGYANQRYALLFRDYLRVHPTSAAAYGELKRRLADNLRDLELYADVKDPACDLIAIAAEDWAEATGWRMGPSDM
jgi:GrpB-like predicted nucleotidyltransferase (UPF0157 family)